MIFSLYNEPVKINNKNMETIVNKWAEDTVTFW